MWPSLKPTQRLCPVAALDPVNEAIGTVQTGWIDMSLFADYLAIVQAGALAAAAGLAITFNQAADAQGATSKPLATKVVAPLTQASTNNVGSQTLVNLKGGDLDVNNGFRWVQMVVTVSGAATEISGLVLGTDQHNGFASDYAPASVNQIVG
jgi:hypothetical protein